MINLNTRYVRKSPEGDESIIIAKTEKEQQHYIDLMKEGFVFTEVRIFKAPEPCASCEA